MTPLPPPKVTVRVSGEFEKMAVRTTEMHKRERLKMLDSRRKPGI
jgi:alpha-acetolactate decarboxylase